MDAGAQARFDAGAGAWAEYNRGPLGRIRQQVTEHNLARHLPSAGDAQLAARALDVGGGSGELALWLLEQGYRVWLLDYAPAMLDQARRMACILPEEARGRLTLCLMAVEDLHCAFAPGSFQLVACHTVIEYLADPQAALAGLAGLLGSGGALSLTFVNRHAQVLRQVWSQGDPAGALAALEDDAFCATLFDVAGVAYSVEQVTDWLVSLGLMVQAVYGVRIFADHVPRRQLEEPRFFDALLELEKAAAPRLSYAALARYIHIISYKNTEHS